MGQPSILIVDDDPGSIQVLGRMLAEHAALRFALSGAEGLRLAQDSPPDLVLLDADMPGMDGFEVCTRLKANPLLADVPVIFVTGHSDTDTELAGLAAGAVDCISKPPKAPLVVARVQTQLRLKSLTDALRRAALTDGLTGVANRRRFDESIHLEWQRAQRYGEPMSLLMIDIDHFKPYNDHHGHQAGDDCLRRVAAALEGVARRPADELARYGGEEFALLLSRTDEAGARHMATAVLEAVQALQLPHGHSPVSRWVTISVGVTTAWGQPAGGAEPAPTVATIIECADRALYDAKHAGRARFRERAAPAPPGHA